MRYLIALLVPLLFAAEPARVSVDGRRVLGPLPEFTLYPNTSLRFAPPHELAARVETEYGRPRITRCWLPLDDMWDYRDGSYHFNFQLGFDRYKNDTVKHRYDRGEITPMDRYYYDHMAAFSRHSEYILLNVRRYEHEVKNGVIPMARWKEMVKTGLRHYKQRYANIRYIEALNEYHIVSFGGLTDEQYYDFYKVMYRIVNELNDEMKPPIPLEVGGPNVVGTPFKPEDATSDYKGWNMGRRMYKFFQNYAKDPDPRKRLDFVSFHDYGLGAQPEAIARYEGILKGWMQENGLRQDLPFFETEIGYAGPKPDPALNQRQATGISSYFYWTRNSRQHHLFPWVLYHEPARQLSLTAFTPEMRMTPFGAALKMWALLKKNEAAVEWKGEHKGVYLLASTDDGGMAVLAWNDAAQPAAAEVSLAGAPRGAVRVREYRVDSKNSNCLLVPSSSGELAAVRDAVQPKAVAKWTTSLEPFSLVLWTIERKK